MSVNFFSMMLVNHETKECLSEKEIKSIFTPLKLVTFKPY